LTPTFLDPRVIMLTVEAMIAAQKQYNGGVAPSGGGVVGGNREVSPCSSKLHEIQ